MNSKILFLDLDGTLLNDNKEITHGNRRAIEDALAQGHQIVVTSGRPLKSSLNQANRLGLAGEGCFVIAYNGAEIFDCSTGKSVFRQTLDCNDLFRIFDEARRIGCYIQTYDREDVVFEAGGNAENARRYCDMVGLSYREIQNVRNDLSAPPVKALAIDYQNHPLLEQMEQWIRQELAGRVECFFSNSHFLEIVSAGMNKGVAVRELCARLGIPVENSVAAGDQGNDVAMLRAAGVGVAMANAANVAKEAADYITCRDNNHDGIEEIIRKFLL